MPQSISSVLLYNSKINHNGLFNCDFGGSGATRDSVMGSTSNIATVKFTMSNCTYIRKDKAIMVDENADVLDAAGVNYCRYINPAFNNTMYFYAFVDSIEYVAPQTSRLHIRTDVFMTYFPKIEWGSQMVERFNRRIPFSARYGGIDSSDGARYSTDYVADAAYSSPVCYASSPIQPTFSFDPYNETDDNGWIIINTSKDISQANPGTDSISPKLSGLPQGTFWFAVQPTKLWLLQHIINKGSLVPNGFVASDVLAIYYVPKLCIEVDTNTPIEFSNEEVCYVFPFRIASGWQGDGSTFFRLLDKAKTMFGGGYTPYNKALLRYPYNYLKITDKSGHEWILKPELFNDSAIEGDDLIIEFTRYLTVGDNISFGIRIENYMNGYCQENLMNFQSFPQIASIANSYQQYMAMNRNSIQNQFRWTNYDNTMGIVNSSMKFATDLATGNAPSLIGDTMSAMNAGAQAARRTETLQASLLDKKNLPNSVVSSGTGNLSLMMGSTGLFLERWAIPPGAAAKIDEFWDRYGYPIENHYIEKPWTKKAQYAYVKTKSCHITGEIPENDRAELDDLFNSGMTIWRNAANYGTYDIITNNDIA